MRQFRGYSDAIVSTISDREIDDAHPCKARLGSRPVARRERRAVRAAAIERAMAGDGEQGVTQASVLAHLSAAGYFRYALPVIEREDLEADLEQWGPCEAILCGRCFYLDASRLAASRAHILLQGMAMTLQQLGLDVGEPALHRDAEVTHLSVCGTRFALHDAAADADESVARLNCSRSFFSIVNRLLEEIGSDERLYAFRPGANDQVGVLLTEELAAVLRELFPEQALERIDQCGSEEAGSNIF